MVNSDHNHRFINFMIAVHQGFYTNISDRLVIFCNSPGLEDEESQADVVLRGGCRSQFQPKMIAMIALNHGP